MSDKSKLFQPIIPLENNVCESIQVEGFPPIEDVESEVLILGTMPGKASLKQQAYYANPWNLFWKLLAELTEKIVPENYEDKKSFLIKNKIALWDMCRICNRIGSSDSKIKEELPNDIKDFIAGHPHLKAIGCNGKTSEHLFHKYIAGIENIKLISLPSSSPANAGISWKKKVEEWSKLKQYLDFNS